MSNGEQLISIIVPIYKVPQRYLRKCIESLINQTYKNIEVLLIDDGSPDECGNICEEYARDNKSVIVIHKANGGLSSSRNAGVLAARGKYVMFVDGDDWINPETCEVLSAYIGDSNIDLLMFCMSKDYSGKSIPYNYFLNEDYIYKGDDIRWLQTQVLNYNSNIATATTKLIKKSILIDNNIFHNEHLKQGAEGIVFNIDLFGKISNALFVKRYFYHYTYNDASISASYDEKNIYSVVDCFEEIRKKVGILPDNEEIIKLYRNRFVFAIVAATISGFFNPGNIETFTQKKEKCKQYLRNPLVKDALYNADLEGISKNRKLVVFLLRREKFTLIQLMGIFRKWQKSHS